MYNFLKGRLIAVRLCLLVTALVLVAIGIATVYSVGNPAESSPVSTMEEIANLWRKQLVFAVIGLVAFVVANLVNYRRLGSASFWMYGGILVLLVLLVISRYGVELPFAPASHNAHRWIVLHPRLPWIQPSEFCKPAYILALAWYLRYRSNYRNFNALIGPFVLTILPMALILVQPDLGTVILMMPIFLTMLFLAGAKAKHLTIIILAAVLFSPLLWSKMKPYQQTRISSVILQSAWVRQKAEQHPSLGRILVGDKFSTARWMRDAGYQLIRSKLAVASGGAKGYGFRKGLFIKYNFLPDRDNDFVFAMIAHQWGFLGCLAVLGLYVLIVGCGLEIATNNTDPFGRLLVIGIIAMFAVEVLVNVSMTVGLMPITGLTLPFISYGGSSLVVNMASVGLLNNVGRCRPFSVAPKS